MLGLVPLVYISRDLCMLVADHVTLQQHFPNIQLLGQLHGSAANLVEGQCVKILPFPWRHFDDCIARSGLTGHGVCFLLLDMTI